MGLFSYLHRRFSTLEKAAADATLSVDGLHASWKKYVQTIPRKRQLVLGLKEAVHGYVGPQQRTEIEELRALLADELGDIGVDVEDEKRLLADLDRIRYDHELQRAHRVHDRLAYSNAEARSLFRLLENLYDLVVLEAKFARMLRGPHRLSALRHLADQVLSEGVIAGHVQRIIDDDRRENESRMFHALVTGARIIRKLDAREHRMHEELTHYYHDTDAPTITARWVESVLSKLEDAIGQAVDENAVDGGPYSDFHFVYDEHLLSRLAIEEYRRLRGRLAVPGIDMHSPLIKAFVSLFQRLYDESYLFEGIG